MSVLAPEPAEMAPKPKRRWPRLLAWALAFLFVVAACIAIAAAGTGYSYGPLSKETASRCVAPEPEELRGDEAPKAANSAEKSIEKLAPKGDFIVIDRVENRLYLREGDQVLLDAVVSAGAGSVLEDPSGKRKWVFDTPVGRFKVKGRRQDPLWTAPDWDYIESGEPFPKRYSDRTQEGMLGEYALDLDVPGYMIHGTLYTRLLGRNVSHGCVRVGRDDLRVLWKKCPIGTSVFIF